MSKNSKEYIQLANEIAAAEGQLKNMNLKLDELSGDAALMAGGMLPPPFGTIADAASLAKSVGTGDWGSAFWDVVGFIPVVGDGAKVAAKGGKLADKLNDVRKVIADVSAALKKKKDDLPKLCKDKLEKNKGDVTKKAEDCGKGNCNKAKPVIKKKRVKCFCVQDHAKGGRDEYEKQLKHQQDGINAMSADDYLAQRGSFTGKNPCTGQSVAKGPGRDRNVTKNAKADRLETQKDKYFDEMRNKGISRTDAKRLGSTKAKLEVQGVKIKGQKNPHGGQDALHNQDMVAGGKDVIGTNGALNEADFGLSDTNRHIGSQWNGERVKSMDAEACQAQKAGQGQEKMNVELRPCGKKEANAAGCKQKKGKK
jgi:hypothetical protein